MSATRRSLFSQFLSLGFLALCLTITSNAALAVPVITNPSFEDDGTFGGNGYTTAITGWTSGGDLFPDFGNVPLTAVSTTGQAFATGTTIPDGTHAAAMQVFSNSIFTTTLSTTITGLTPGSQYYITFAENARNTDPVVNASVTLDATTIVASHGTSFSPTFTPVTSAVFTAPNTTALLTFLNQKPGNSGIDASYVFDNVQIFQVPEPTSLVLGCLGTAALIATARRRYR